jgi:hypothetical protein
MRRELTEILQLEVVFQTWTAWVAWNRLSEIVRGEWKPELIHEVDDPRTREASQVLAGQAMVWECVRSILTATAAVSRLKQRLERQGEQMASGMAANIDTLFADRSLRNAFEHVEQELPKWLDENKDLVAAGKVALIGWGANEPEGAKCFRYLNTTTWELRVGDTNANLGKMVETLRSATRGGANKARLVLG